MGGMAGGRRGAQVCVQAWGDSHDAWGVRGMVCQHCVGSGFDKGALHPAVLPGARPAGRGLA